MCQNSKRFTKAAQGFIEKNETRRLLSELNAVYSVPLTPKEQSYLSGTKTRYRRLVKHECRHVE